MVDKLAGTCISFLHEATCSIYNAYPTDRICPDHAHGQRRCEQVDGDARMTPGQTVGWRVFDRSRRWEMR